MPFCRIGNLKVMGKRPRLGIKYRSLLLLVIVGRSGIDFEQRGQREEPVLPEIQDVVRVCLPEQDILLLNVSVL